MVKDILLYKIIITPKGYILRVIKDRVVVKYFLRDEEHLSEKDIPDMLFYNKFIVLGEPFGANKDLIPIFSLMDKPKPIVINTSKPVTISIPEPAPSKKYDYRLIVIWRYYRSLVLKNNKPSYIKECASKMKAQLRLRGVEGTYLWVLNAKAFESNNITVVYKQYFEFKYN